jgi:hypothetical protein
MGVQTRAGFKLWSPSQNSFKNSRSCDSSLPIVHATRPWQFLFLLRITRSQGLLPFQ